jgi:hypothetical protein
MQVTDDEWTVIQPLFEDVMEKQRIIMMQNFRGMRPGGGPPPPGMDQEGGPGRGPGGGPGGFFQMAPDPEREDLQSIVADENASADEIKTKLTAFRSARSKKQEELKTAREKLRAVLTVRQEAILVLRGTLD